MEADCLPIIALPGTTALYRDYTDARGAAAPALLRRWYPADPFSMEWAKAAPALAAEQRETLADLLAAQQVSFGAGEAALANVEKLRAGAAAVVTGQQVGLFGGPLLTLLKAATAIRKAQDATRVSGREHVPVFWLASEDHDVDEVNQVTMLTRAGVEMRRATLDAARPRQPAGSIALGAGVDDALAWAEEAMQFAPPAETLRAAYGGGKHDAAGGPTLASAFARLLTGLFRDHGLIVMDASARGFHALGAPVLRAAVQRAEELQSALAQRSEELKAAGYHAQVLVEARHSLLFLMTANAHGVQERVPLRRDGDVWRAGQQTLTTAELLQILETEPERLSPNALLRPVFQDCILPTAAYVGGPAEIAYFAQSAVLYDALLGRVTPVLPRLSATLVAPAIGALMAKYGVQLPQVFEARTAHELAVRLGARSMPVEGKRKIAAAGNAMDAELTALTDYMTAMSAELGRSAAVSASKMRYQMNRLRRMAARFEVERQAVIAKDARTLMDNLFPERHLQERVLAGVQMLAEGGPALVDVLVASAGQDCPGHKIIAIQGTGA